MLTPDIPILYITLSGAGMFAENSVINVCKKPQRIMAADDNHAKILSISRIVMTQQ